MNRLSGLLALSLSVWLLSATTAFALTPEEQARFKHLTEELRCLVCQNQTIADSDAPLAKDLRDEIEKMIVAGNDNRQIIDFMVERYGDFVLYRPPLNPTTWLLWFGPGVLLVGGLWILLRQLKRQSAQQGGALSEQEQTRLKTLLQDTSDANE